jgi:hypothetical protein
VNSSTRLLAMYLELALDLYFLQFCWPTELGMQDGE